MQEMEGVQKLVAELAEKVGTLGSSVRAKQKGTAIS